jgi:hypothetical protein
MPIPHLGEPFLRAHSATDGISALSSGSHLSDALSANILCSTLPRDDTQSVLQRQGPEASRQRSGFPAPCDAAGLIDEQATSVCLLKPENFLAVVFVGTSEDAIDILLGKELRSSEGGRSDEDPGRFLGHEHGRFHGVG